jgi:hypothetical protein
MILNTRLNNKKSGAWRRSWAPGSTIRRVVRDDDLEHPTQELSDHVSSGGHAASYDRSNRWSDTTTDRDFIDDNPIIRVSPHWDPNNEAWRISNREAINSSSKYSTINRSMTIKSGSSSSSHTPLQSRLQHSPTTGVKLRDKSGLTLQNRVCWVINKQCATASEETYSNPISRAQLAWMRQHDIFIYSRNLQPRSQRQYLSWMNPIVRSTSIASRNLWPHS